MTDLILLSLLAVSLGGIAILASRNYWGTQIKEELGSLKAINEKLLAKSNALHSEIAIERQKNTDLIKEVIVLRATLEKEVSKNTQIVHQKKSSETRLGQISEQLAPFLEGFKYDPKTAHFLGSPLDYVIFDTNSDDPAVVFLEIKTGGSKLSSSQKMVKNLIKLGKVRFEELRIDPKGQKVKVTKTEEQEQ